MASPVINKNLLRRKMAQKDIFTFAELARRINRTPTAVQFMIERPSRFTKAVTDTMKLLGVKKLEELTDEKNEPAKV